MIKIGDICPLFFNPIKNDFQQDIDYIQKFYTTDKILIQVLSDDSGDVVSLSINDLVSGSRTTVNITSYQINSSTTLYYAQISNLGDSVYSLLVQESNSGSIYESEPFVVCSDPSILQETCLIEYSNEDNNSPFNNIFWVGNIQQVFEFRIEGGFKPGGIDFKVENEQFRNQLQNIVELYSVPYATYNLTCGNAAGIPYWMIEFVNNILSLTYFFVNGERYVRSGNSVPEKTQISEDGQMFNTTILLEKNKNAYLFLSPNPIVMTGTSYIVNVKSNVNWEFEITEGNDFISYEGNNYGSGNKNIILKLVENTTGSQRVGKLIFSTNELNDIELDIIQRSITPSATIDQDTLSVIRQGGNYTIHVSANTDWQIDYHPSWVTLSQESGGAGEFDITVTVSPNTVSTSREDDIGFVTVVEGGEGANCVVTQTAEGNYLYADTNVVALAQEGTSVSIGFNSNLDVTGLEWGSVEGSEWASISVDDNDWVLNISAQSNAGSSTRTGKVFVQTSDGGIRVEITINQAGVAVGTYVKTEPYYYNDHGGTDVVYYQIDTDCSDLVVVYADLPDWLNEITYDNTTKELQVHYIGGISGDPRFLECTLTSESDSSISASFYIGCNNETGDQFAYLLPSLDVHFDVLAWGGSYQVQEWYLFTNGIDSYTLTAPEWATLRDFESPNPAEGGRKVLLMLKANSGETGRTGDLTIQFEGLTVGTLFLSQVSAGDNYIQASTWLAFTYDSYDQVEGVLLTSPLTDLEATVDDDWLNITDFGNVGDVNWSLDYGIQPNTTGKMRETYIRIKSPSAGIELPIYIRQDA